jgi:hypothetical protein
MDRPVVVTCTPSCTPPAVVTPGPHGADTELVRSEKRPLAVAKMPLTSARGHFFDYCADGSGRRGDNAGGGVSRPGRPRLAARRRTSRGAADEPGTGTGSKWAQWPRRTGRGPRSIDLAFGVAGGRLWLRRRLRICILNISNATMRHDDRHDPPCLLSQNPSAAADPQAVQNHDVLC